MIESRPTQLSQIDMGVLVQLNDIHGHVINLKLNPLSISEGLEKSQHAQLLLLSFPTRYAYVSTARPKEAAHRRAIGQMERGPHLFGRGWAHNSLCHVLRLQARHEEGLAVCRQALEIGLATGDLDIEEIARRHIAAIHRSRGALQQAFATLRPLIDQWRGAADREIDLARVLNDVSWIFYTLGDDDRARAAAEEALGIARRGKLISQEARALNRLGQIALQNGRNEQARKAFEQARHRAADSGKLAIEASVTNHLGRAYRKLGRLEEAEAMYREALALFRQHRSDDDMAAVLINLGALAAERGNILNALERYRQARELAQRSRDRSRLASAYFGLAQAHRALDQLEEARRHVESALLRVESLRAEATAPSLRSSYLSRKLDYYRFYVDLLMQLHESEATSDHRSSYASIAFAASERMRARSLLDALGETGADLRAGVDPALLEEEQSLRSEIRQLEQEEAAIVAAQPASGDRKGWRGKLRKLEDKLEELRDVQAEIRLYSPQRDRRGEGQTLSLAAFQDQLDEGTQLVVYTLGEQRSFLWLVDSRSLTSHMLAGRRRLEYWARRAHDLLARSSDRGSQLQAELALERLSEFLLAPIADRLTAARLVVVVDGDLHYVPFAALPDPRSPSSKSLVQAFQVTYLPSASVIEPLRASDQIPSSGDGRLAVFADPVFQLDDDRLREAAAHRSAAPTEAAEDLLRAAADLGVEGFERLPFSRSEAEAILALVPSARALRALDFRASREAVLSADLRDYSYLHFATHSLLHPRRSALSGLVLSLVDPAGRPVDGFVRTYEIQDLELSAELVVLSACRTALGKEVSGEGLVGLSQAFLLAGSRRLVVTLWDVSDRASSVLMEHFYRGIFEQRLPPAAALRAAQIELQRRPPLALALLLGRIRSARRVALISPQRESLVTTLRRSGFSLPRWPSRERSTPSAAIDNQPRRHDGPERDRSDRSTRRRLAARHDGSKSESGAGEERARADHRRPGLRSSLVGHASPG